MLCVGTSECVRRMHPMTSQEASAVGEFSGAVFLYWSCHTSVQEGFHLPTLSSAVELPLVSMFSIYTEYEVGSAAAVWWLHNVHSKCFPRKMRLPTPPPP